MNKILSDYYEIREKHDAALGALEKEVLRIIKVIKSVFKMDKYAWWSFKYYEDSNDHPPLPRPIEKNDEYGDYLPIYISDNADSGSWMYHETIPTKFFDMSDQEIETYLQNEIATNIKREAEEEKKRLLKAEAKKSEKMKIAESAIKKLTKEERKALGLK